ncbi:MAG: hypothetical protein ACE3JQ_06730 [Paenisporosarcina sp.]
MTASSFSSIQPSMRNQVMSEQSLSLKQGQVFHGSIKKLYPDQTAEVHVGNQKMIAKLEVPLKAGDSHYFQVTGVKPDLQLKVVTGPLQPTTSVSGQIQQLIDSLQLPKTAVIQTLVQHMVKEQIPLSKDQLVQAEQWIKSLPPQTKIEEALFAIQRMSDLKLPFTKEIFRSLISGQDKTGLHTILDAFKLVLKNDSSIPQEQRTSLQQVLNQVSQPLAKELGGTIIGRMMENMLSTTVSVSEKASMLNVLKEAGLVAKQATVSNFLSSPKPSNEFARGESQSTISQQLIQLQLPAQKEVSLKLQALQNSIQQNTLLTTDAKQQIQQIIQRMELVPPKSQEWPVLYKTLSNEVMKSFAIASQTIPFHTDHQKATPKDHVLFLLTSLTGIKADAKTMEQITMISSQSSQLPVQKIVNHAELAVQSAINSKAFEQVLKQVLNDIGIAYEAKLSQSSTNIHQLSETLKPQLVALIQDAAVSGPVKEAAEAIVSRMNGLQILSGENGPQHQLLMQVPIDFFGKRMDATLQWNGQMKENGKIDSNYARIMFYLDLASLKETIIDMQVQNRVITVNIFNEDDALQQYAEPFKEALKVGLRSLDYQLSGVFLKRFTKDDLSTSKTSIGTKKQLSSRGVDIRV